MLDVFADVKCIKKSLLLFLRRIQTILVHPEFHVSIVMLKEFLSIRIHPTSKEVGFLLRRS